jgi:hypothetical protein
MQGGRERNKPITLALTDDMKVLVALAIDDALWSQANQLAQTKAGVSEDADDEPVAFTTSHVLDPLYFLPRKHVDEPSVPTRLARLEVLDSACASCPGKELVDGADVGDDGLPGQQTFLPALE